MRAGSPASKHRDRCDAGALDAGGLLHACPGAVRPNTTILRVRRGAAPLAHFCSGPSEGQASLRPPQHRLAASSLTIYLQVQVPCQPPPLHAAPPKCGAADEPPLQAPAGHHPPAALVSGSGACSGWEGVGPGPGRLGVAAPARRQAQQLPVLGSQSRPTNPSRRSTTNSRNSVTST